MNHNNVLVNCDQSNVLSDSEKATARNNIGAISATEVPNSDWNATSGSAEILNKPTIPTITMDYGMHTDKAKAVRFDMIGYHQISLTSIQDVQSSPGFVVPPIDPDFDDGKVLMASTDISNSYPVWSNPYVLGAEWHESAKTTEGSTETHTKLHALSFTNGKNAIEIFGTVSFDVVTAGRIALCPGNANGSYTATYGSQCVNMGNLAVGHYCESYLFRVNNPGDVQYLVIKGESGRTASSITIRAMHYAIKKDID